MEPQRSAGQDKNSGVRFYSGRSQNNYDGFASGENGYLRGRATTMAVPTLQ